MPALFAMGDSAPWNGTVRGSRAGQGPTTGEDHFPHPCPAPRRPSTRYRGAAGVAAQAAVTYPLIEVGEHSPYDDRDIARLLVAGRWDRPAKRITVPVRTIRSGGIADLEAAVADTRRPRCPS